MSLTIRDPEVMGVTASSVTLAFRVEDDAGATDATARVLVDGAQAVQHGPVDVQALGVDFYAFSGHKAFGPTGVGVLWGKAEALGDQLGGLLEAPLLPVEIRAPEERGGIGRTRKAGDRVPDSRQEPQQAHVVLTPSRS